MNEELIIVDDVEAVEAGPSTINGFEIPIAQPKLSSLEGHTVPSISRLRSSTHPPRHTSVENPERTTRSATQKLKAQPKLKLKLSEKASQAPGTSFLGQYDRELDSDEEDLAFEEQFILRLPPGEDLDKLRKMVAAREVSNDVWFKFKDSRRAVFHIGNSLYSSKLVDLPCVIESQKTIDNKQMFKVADICQMLVVEKKIENEDHLAGHKNFNIDDFIWPHGITPPLHHVRKRRFRKRVNRRTIESVEQEVERLLDEDALAMEVKFEVLDNVNPDLSDSEFIERDEPLDAPTPAMSDMGEVQTPGYDVGDDEGEEDEEDEDEGGEGGIDEELAAELDLALGDEEDADDDDDEESEEEEDDEEDDDEDAQARKLINEEIRDLEAAVAKKGREIASSANPLIRKRFEDALKKLTADLEMKFVQRDEMKEKQRMRKEGFSMDVDTDAEGGANDEREGNLEEEEDDNLFGSDD